MKPKPLVCLASVLCSISFGQPMSIPPPPPGSNLPGQNEVKIKTYWLAPYLRVSEGFGGTTVTWFTEDGHIKRQRDVTSIEPGFVTITGSMEHGETILGVNEDWEIHLPPAPPSAQVPYSLSGYITSTPDSRVFVHEYHPTGGTIALDIYIHGKLASKVGPYFQYLGRDVSLNNDGSASLAVWSDESKTNVETVVLDSEGHIVSAGSSQPHPGSAPNLGPNPVCVEKIPTTHNSLYWTSVGFESNRYHLIDEEAGKQLWDIPCPGDGQPLAVGLTPKVIIISVAELYGPGGPWRGSEWVFLNSKRDWIRAFYAINPQNGQTVARWQEQYPRRYSDSDYGHFLSLNNQLFYITPEEFTKINVDDILAKKNGWR